LRQDAKVFFIRFDVDYEDQNDQVIDPEDGKEDASALIHYMHNIKNKLMLFSLKQKLQSGQKPCMLTGRQFE
jgi:hypothetical protein